MTYFEKLNDPVLLIIFIVLSGTSFFLSCMFVVVTRYVVTGRGENDQYAVQAAHDGVVSRLGGCAMFLSLLSFLWALNLNMLNPILLTNFDVSFLYLLFASSVPIFIVGLSEDLGYLISPSYRLLASIFSGVLVVWTFEVWVKSIGLPIIDIMLSFWLTGVIFTLVAASGVVNAFNLIDGLNGLAGFTGMFVAISLSFIAFEVNQIEVLRFLFVFSACILGFMFLNFPLGKIFLGDAGAYVMGHILVWTAIILVNSSSDISPFAIFLIFFWPIADTLLAIWRRWKKRKRADHPDRLHFHQLVMRFFEIRFLGRNRRRLTNPVTTIFLLPFIAAPQIMGVMFWNNFEVSILLSIGMIILFFVTYIFGLSFTKRMR